ncbi:MAG: transporter substrate-binding protein [Actinomycetia bacterium]|nr:transporter substrate-binding protein [Actinomycetes bacterium]
MRLRRNVTGLVVLALLSGLLVACSSSTTSSGGAASSTGGTGATPAGARYTKPSGSVRGYDGSTLKLASLGIKSQLPGVEFGSRARVKRFNDTNEVPGIKLDYTEFANDNLDRATALSEARRLVAEQQIFAIVGDTSSFNPLAYFQQQHVPYFGWAFDSTYCTDKPDPTLWGFGIDGCLVPDSPKVVGDMASNLYKYLSGRIGKAHPTVALFSSDSQSGQNAAKFDKPPYDGVGFNVVYAKGIIPAGTPVSDYTPYVQQLLRSNNGSAPDVIVCLLTTDCIPIYGLLTSSKYGGVFVSSLYADQLLTALDGSVVTTAFAPFGDATPANAQLSADVKAVKPGQAPDLGVAVGYFSTDMFIQALKTLVQAKGKSFISPENLQQAAAYMTWEIKDQIGPAKYPESTVLPSPFCSAVVVDEGAQWKTVEPYSCSTKTFPISG